MTPVEREHPVWAEAFNNEVRQEQLAEDSSAWRAITGILITIVSAGVILAVFSVWICT